MYLLLSVSLLWWLLAYVEEKQGSHWVKSALLAVVFLAALGLVSVFLVPRQFIQNLSRRSSRVMKFAFVFNYLACLLLIEIMIGEWWARALILAGLLGVTWLGSWLLCRVWPMAQQVRGIYDQAQGNWEQFDPSAPQGRKGRFD